MDWEQRLLHVQRHEHRVHLALPAGRARARLAVPRPPLDGVVPALRHLALAARADAGRRLPGARAPVALRALPAARPAAASRSWSGRRRRGRCRRTSPPPSTRSSSTGARRRRLGRRVHRTPTSASSRRGAAASSSAGATTARSTTSARGAGRAPGDPVGRSVALGRGHRHRPHRARRRPRGLRARREATTCRCSRPSTRPGASTPSTAGSAGCRTAEAAEPIIEDLRERGPARAARDDHATPIRTAGAATRR